MKALACVGMGKTEPGILEGFRSAGLEIDEICVSDFTVDKWKEDEYLFVFTAVFSPEVSSVCQNALIPYLSYIMELPDEAVYHSSVKNPCNFIFCFDRDVCEGLQQVIPGRCFHLPLGADSSWFSESAIEKNMDVSFVGSLCEGNEAYDKADGFSEYARGYLDALIKTQVRIYGYNLLEAALNKDIVKEIKRNVPCELLQGGEAVGLERSIIARHILGNKVTELERHQLLHTVSRNFEIHLYTADEVSGLPDLHFHKPVTSWEERAKIYRTSRINLHFTHRSVTSGIPQEIFEIMAAGGFVLTNFQPEIPENFVIGEHLETFVNEKELLDKIAYYLEHEEERVQIAKAGQQAVKEYHSYLSRAVTMFNTVFSDDN